MRCTSIVLIAALLATTDRAYADADLLISRTYIEDAASSQQYVFTAILPNDGDRTASNFPVNCTLSCLQNQFIPVLDNMSPAWKAVGTWSLRRCSPIKEQHARR